LKYIFWFLWKQNGQKILSQKVSTNSATEFYFKNCYFRFNLNNFSKNIFHTLSTFLSILQNLREKSFRVSYCHKQVDNSILSIFVSDLTEQTKHYQNKRSQK
jgi:hypothetical protein